MTEADKVVFVEALQQHEFEPEFSSKKWAYIVDQQSVAGNYNSQIQFNLGNIGNTGLWADIREALIRFPIAITITDTSTADHSIGWDDSTNFVSNMAATIKGSFYSMINSCQLTVGNTTLQAHMPYLSSKVHFDILTTWSIEEYNKWRDALALSIDEVVPSFTATSNGKTLNKTGLANFDGASAFDAAHGGFNLSYDLNKGFTDRAFNLNNSIAATGLKQLIDPHGYAQGEGVYAAAAAASHSTTPYGVVWACTYMATVRLKDLCPSIMEMPPLKNMRGFLYLAYNAAQTSYALSAASPGVISGPSNTQLFGNSNPMLLGAQPNVGTTATGANKIIAKCTVSGASITLGDTQQISPAFAASRLYCPLIEANPTIDSALSIKKTIRYEDRVLTTVNLTAGQSLATVISAGVVNPMRITILPTFIATGKSTLTVNASPELSPFDPVPMASSCFAALSNIQILVGGKPVIQTPTLYTFENFQQEIANELGSKGGQDEEKGSGFLRQTQWEQLYRYYTFNLARRLESQDGNAMSIQLSVTNDTQCDMRLLVWTDYEREANIDTAIGLVTQNF